MKRAALIALLILAACSGDGETTDLETTAPTLTTLPAATPPPSSTTVPPTTTTTTTMATTTTTTRPPNATAAFGLTQVVFGDGAFVVITNWGNDTGNLDGHWLGQATANMALPEITLAPGEQALVGISTSPPPDLAGMAATVDLGLAIGILDPNSGEVALHNSLPFDDPTNMIAYVAWGDGDHLRTDLAVAAGVWVGEPVEVFDDAPSISSGVYPATDNLSWFADIGG